MTPVLLGLGGNQGDRRAALRAALAGLAPAVAVDACSSVYETAPVHVTDQPAFLNMAARGRTLLGPEPLLAALKALERRLGRTPTRRWGPRRIDVDILFYGDRVLDAPTLTVPHPRMAERAFVLAPAAEVAADWRHPVLGRTVAELLERLPASGPAVEHVGPIEAAGPP